MLGAGLLAKKAVERGLSVPPYVKTSLAPGSRVVTDYLRRPACRSLSTSSVSTWSAMAARPASATPARSTPASRRVVTEHDLIAASVLSGNRNFEARIQQNIKANFLMSPPLVVAFALAGQVDVDLTKEPIGKDAGGRDVYLRDIWPSLAEVREAMVRRSIPETYRRLYADFER